MSELQRILEARRKRNGEALLTAAAASGLDDDGDDDGDDDDCSAEGVISGKGGVVAAAAAQVESPSLPPTRTTTVTLQQQHSRHVGGNVGSSGQGSNSGLGRFPVKDVQLAERLRQRRLLTISPSSSSGSVVSSLSTHCANNGGVGVYKGDAKVGGGGGEGQRQGFFRRTSPSSGSPNIISNTSRSDTCWNDSKLVLLQSPTAAPAAAAATTDGPVVSIHNNEDNTVERIYQQHTKQWQKKTTSATTTTTIPSNNSNSNNKVIPEFMRMRLRKSTTAAHPYDIKEEVTNDIKRESTTPTTTSTTTTTAAAAAVATILNDPTTKMTTDEYYSSTVVDVDYDNTYNNGNNDDNNHTPGLVGGRVAAMTAAFAGGDKTITTTAITALSCMDNDSQKKNIVGNAVLAARNAIDQSNINSSMSNNVSNQYNRYSDVTTGLLQRDDPPLQYLEPSSSSSVVVWNEVDEEEESSVAENNNPYYLKGVVDMLDVDQDNNVDIGTSNSVRSTITNNDMTISSEQGREEEDLFGRSFIDAGIASLSQLPTKANDGDDDDSDDDDSDDDGRIDNVITDPFDPFAFSDHEDDEACYDDGDCGLPSVNPGAEENEEEEEFEVNAPNLADSDSPRKRSSPTMPSWLALHPKGLADVDGKDFGMDVPQIVGSFHVQRLSFGTRTNVAATDSAKPCQNPLSGNMIICRRRQQDVYIEEYDFNNSNGPTSSSSHVNPVAVVSACVSVDEIKVKLTRTNCVGVDVLGVSSILSLAAGLHRVKGRVRVRVAALVEICIASSRLSINKIRIVVVWRWGYDPTGTTLTSLQSVLTMDSIGHDKSNRYDPKTLQVADGLLFFGGHSRNTTTNEAKSVASIFVAKPAARLSWTAVPFPDNSSMVVTLAVNNDSRPYLAVGMSDGSIRVLTYNLAARTNRLSVQNQSSSLLPTLCYMRGELDVKELGDDDYLWSKGERFHSMSNRGGAEILPFSQCSSTDHERFGDARGQCTSLAWIQYESSGISSLPLLAAAFSSGIAIYSVVPPPFQSAHNPRQQLSVIPRILPLAQSKFTSSIEESEIESVSQATQTVFRKPNAEIGWFDLGPRSPPGLTLLFEHEMLSFQRQSNELISRSCLTRLCLCAIDILVEMDGKNDMPHAIGIICQKELDVDEGDGISIVNISAKSEIVCYSSGSLLKCQPMVRETLYANESNRSIDSYFSSLLRPISSVALGLDSDGSVYHGVLKSAVRADDVMLTVFSTTSCTKDMSPPVLSKRHWLLISSPGDATSDVTITNSLSVDAGHGGASTDILFELTCAENPIAGLVPQRIAKEDGGRRVAVMFSSGYFGGNYLPDVVKRVRTHTEIPINSIAYTILDIEHGLKDRGSASFKLLHGRDVAFLPPLQTEDGHYCSSLVVLDVSGSNLSVTTVISSSILSEINDKVVESVQMCSLQYECIEGRRVFLLLNGEQPEILLSGHSTDGRSCLLRSMHSLISDSVGGFLRSTLVENNGFGQRIYLRPGEEVVSVLELPKHMGATNANVAVATQERVMILSAGNLFAIVTEMDLHVTSTSLSPLGSHCVAFFASIGDGRSRLMYLSCLEGKGNYGVIATLPSSRYGKSNLQLAAIRPDRFVYLSSHSSLQMIDEGENLNVFTKPMTHTRPLFLLEPLIANALCQDQARGTDAASNDYVQLCLRTIIEKFGRKDVAFPHSDDEGMGIYGTGITSHVYDMLAYHQCTQAASTLLTGTLPTDAIYQPKIVPPWVPTQSKLSVAIDTAVMVQVLSYGDNELAELVRNTDRRETVGDIPGPQDLTCILSEMLAVNILREGYSFEAIKLLDLAGRHETESLLAQLIFLQGSNSSTKRGDAKKLLKDVANASDSNPDQSKLSMDVVLRLMMHRRDYGGSLPEKKAPNVPLLQLTPSLQSIWEDDRVRNFVIDNVTIKSMVPSSKSSHSHDGAWRESIAKTKHIWTAGPCNEKDRLLLMSGLEDWFGRCCPANLGKDGVELAAEKGEQTLAEILSVAAKSDEADEDSNSCKNILNRQNDWVDGIGEGRDGEDNLSLYIRFSEGDDEDCNWRSEGFTDLTKHAHIARLLGYELASVEATTSSVDEGEEGKIKLLYDLVYREGAPRDQPTGLVVLAPRGGSLDVGMLHDAHHTSRQRCTVEMWYHLPEAHLMTDEIILVRRSLFHEEDSNASKLCMPDEKHNVLWELAVLTTGSLELRTGAGSVVTSVMYSEGEGGLVSRERDDGVGGWNHLCLIFAPLTQIFSTDLLATILMNGSVVVPGSKILVNPFGSETDQDVTQNDIEEALEKTVLIFGIGPSIGFRMTDLRVWSCRRSEDEVNLMMYEYLKDAEMKKKLKVNIRKVSKNLITPICLQSPESGKRGFALAPPPRQLSQRAVPAAVVRSDEFIPRFADFSDDIVGSDVDTTNVCSPEQIDHIEEDVEIAASPNKAGDSMKEDERLASAELEVMVSDLLSTTVKKSAAAALVRGPPAARHFGGNRGGLVSEHINYGSKCDGVGPIIICGADKSIAWFNDRDPPGRTIPLGASGAVLSDIMDEDMSEYMCCYLAKEKRMIVFELSRKTVVVELEMKTKLNFWRYLPPEAHGSSLVFVLITPIGGFHWKPLDPSPRPFQVWKRGPEFESKKILAYEEGGSNGLTGINARSTVALVIASSASPKSSSVVEAYCISMYSGGGLLCISSVILGAALYSHTSGKSPLPFVVSITRDITSQIVLDIEELNETSGTLAVHGIVASTVLNRTDVHVEDEYEPPSMSMGHTPEVLCCCHDDFIVVVIRRKGLIFAYDFSSEDELVFIGKSKLRHYVVDAAIRSSDVSVGSVELVALLCDTEDLKDGLVATVHISRFGVHLD